MAPVLRSQFKIKLDGFGFSPNVVVLDSLSVNQRNVCDDVLGKAYSKNTNIGDNSDKVIISSMSKNLQY
jgi:hypothetical protein